MVSSGDKNSNAPANSNLNQINPEINQIQILKSNLNTRRCLNKPRMPFLTPTTTQNHRFSIHSPHNLNNRGPETTRDHSSNYQQGAHHNQPQQLNPTTRWSRRRRREYREKGLEMYQVDLGLITRNNRSKPGSTAVQGKGRQGKQQSKQVTVLKCVWID